MATNHAGKTSRNNGNHVVLRLCTSLLVLLFVNTTGIVIYAGSIPTIESERLSKLAEWVPLWNCCCFAVVTSAICIQTSLSKNHYWLLFGVVLFSFSPFLIDRFIPNTESWIGFGMFCLKLGIGGILGFLVGVFIGTAIRWQSVN